MPIALNFVPLENQQFSFRIYRKAYDGNRAEDRFRVDRLPVGNDSYEQFYTSFEACEQFHEFICGIGANHQLTLAFLHRQLVRSLSGTFKAEETVVIESPFCRELRIILGVFKEGYQYISLSAHWLSSVRQFGFLVNFGFCCNEGQPFNREVQRLSLSLDTHYRSNRHYYRDVHTAISAFLERNQYRIRLTIDDGPGIKFGSNFAILDSKMLEKKSYVVGGNNKVGSQFLGINQFGPQTGLAKPVHIIFIFDQKFRQFANEVYLGLIGKASPGTFAGMERFFRTCVCKESVSHVPVESYDHKIIVETANIVGQIAAKNPDKSNIALFIEPNGFDDFPPSESPYYILKYQLIRMGIPLQVINADHLKDRSGLKWSISNIALQIFSKCGGIPWTVVPRNADCLILGIGASVRYEAQGIKRFFAYSICLDSSGLYEQLKVLADDTDHSSYLKKLQSGLETFFADERLRQRFTRCALHIPYRIRRKEIQSIEKALKNITTFDFRVIKVNVKNKYFGFAEHNTLVPYESSYVQIGHREYLVWFEGLQFGKEIVNKRIGRPVHIQFIDSTSGTDDASYLQDVLNLSGANWRGFNSKQEPISIYYARLLSHYSRAFDVFDDYNIDTLATKLPWFL